MEQVNHRISIVQIAERGIYRDCGREGNMDRLSDYQKAQKWLENYEWDLDPDADDNLATICYALQEMEKYEDLEEQGRLLKLPCAVGEIVYRIEEADCENCLEERPEIYGKCTYKIGEFCGYEEIIGTIFDLDMFSKIGETVFSTHEEAEAALKKMEEKKV